MQAKITLLFTKLDYIRISFTMSFIFVLVSKLNEN